MRRIVSQMEVSFRRYLSEVLGLRSAGHYLTSVRTAARYLREKGLIDGELFDVESLSKLRELRDVLYGDAAFKDQNAVGNNMDSVGLNHFVDFLGLEVGGDAAAVPKVLTNDDLVKLDAPIAKPAEAPKVVYGWNRDRVIVEQVLKADNYLCEIDARHKTFVTRRNDQLYLEGHHLIPISHQDEFEWSLDVYANIIGLCPNCHRQLHFGKKNEVRNILKGLYNLRADRLVKSGIEVSKDEFLALAVG